MLSGLLEKHPSEALLGSTAQGTRWSYGDFKALTEVRRTRLAALGVAPGALIAVDTQPVEAFLAWAFAAWDLGAALLPLEARLPETSRSERLKHSGAACHAGGDTLQPLPQPASVDERCALVLYTSGSSGHPKGVMLSAEGISANVDGILSYLPVQHSDATVITLPLGYAYSLVGQVLVSVRAGVPLLFAHQTPFPLQQLEAMRSAGRCGLSSVPTGLALLCRTASELSLEQRPTLAYAASAGAPLPAPLVAQVREVFGATLPFFNQYGLTEASPRVAAISVDDPKAAQGSVGRPLPGLTVGCWDEHGTLLPPGHEGELVVSGPSVMLGYLGEPERTRGFLRTRDWGTVDSGGYVFPKGRLDGVIQCGGERVSLAEVTRLLKQVARVDDACVLALPDALAGHRLVAFVATAAEAATVRSEAFARLSPAQRPVRFIALSSLPLNPHGKPDRAALEALIR